MSQPLTEARLTVARPWATAADDVLTHLEADAGGLSASDAAERLEIAGPNRLPEPARKPPEARASAFSPRRPLARSP